MTHEEIQAARHNAEMVKSDNGKRSEAYEVAEDCLRALDALEASLRECEELRAALSTVREFAESSYPDINDLWAVLDKLDATEATS